MKVQELFEADAKKYTDKDGKTVYQLPRKESPAQAKETPKVATKRGDTGVGKGMSSAFDRPSDKELFGNANYDSKIKLRKKGEKADPDIIGKLTRFAHEKDGQLYYMDEKTGKRQEKSMGTVKVVGKTLLQHPMWETWHEAQTLELHFEDGSIIPATRLGPGKVLSQDYAYKAYMPSGTEKFWKLLRDTGNR